MEISSRYSPVSGSDIDFKHSLSSAPAQSAPTRLIDGRPQTRLESQRAYIQSIRDGQVRFDDLALVDMPAGHSVGSDEDAVEKAIQRLEARARNVEIGCLRGERCKDITQAVLACFGGMEGVVKMLTSARQEDRELAVPFLTLGAKRMGSTRPLDLQNKSISELNASVQAIGRLVTQSQDSRPEPASPVPSSSSLSAQPELLTASMFEVVPPAASLPEPDDGLTESLFLTVSNPDAPSDDEDGLAEALFLTPSTPSGSSDDEGGDVRFFAAAPNAAQPVNEPGPRG